MATNNAWNTGKIATTAETIAGTSTINPVSPSGLQSVMDIARWNFMWTENLGMRYASSTFTVLGADWSNLSSTNYAKVTLPSNVNPGQLVRYTVTANQSFVDATGSSTITGNTFGTTAGVAWGEIAPFFLYVAASSSDTSPVFFISRMPGRHHLPPASIIGQSGSAIADADDGFFALSAITAANYASSACKQIGSFRMTKDASDAWTVTTFNDEDGIGQSKDDDWYNMPTGQKGAASGKYMLDNGGTAPTFTASNQYIYNISHDGICHISINLNNTTGGTAGNGAVNARIALPFDCLYSTYDGSGMYTNGATTNIFISRLTAAAAYAEMLREGNGALLTNGGFNNNSRAINCSLSFKTLES